jgi:hypothetical protein
MIGHVFEVNSSRFIGGEKQLNSPFTHGHILRRREFG